MARDNLPEFLEGLASAGQLARVAAEVDADEEIPEITRRVAAADGPALLFERVRGRRHVVVTNLFGTAERLCRTLGVDSLETLADRLLRAGDGGGRSWLDRLRSRSAGPALERFASKPVKVAASQQVVKLGRDVDLGELPALRSWCGETVPTITAGRLLLPTGPQGPTLVGRPLLPIIDRNRLAVVWGERDAAWQFFQRELAAGERVPLAVAVGGDPLWLLLSELSPLGEVDPAALAGLLREKPAEVVPGRTQNVIVPAEAEIVLEGYIDPEESPVQCGPIAAPGGVLFQPTPCPALHVTAITQRANAAFVADVYQGLAGRFTPLSRLNERLLLAMLQAVVPEVVDLALPPLGGRHSYAVVAIQQEYVGAARRAASAVWGLGPLMLTKSVIVVDAGMNVRNMEEVLAHVGAGVLPQRDVFIHDGPTDPFDRATADQPQGCKLGIDATTKLDCKAAAAEAAAVASNTKIAQQVAERWPQYGLAGG